jgi:hypothetical protein
MTTKLNADIAYTICPDCGMTLEGTQTSIVEGSYIFLKPPSKEEQTALTLAGRLFFAQCYKCHVKEMDEERARRGEE